MLLRFIMRWAGYNVGEVASFPERDGRNLVDRGFAVAVKPVAPVIKPAAPIVVKQDVPAAAPTPMRPRKGALRP